MVASRSIQNARAVLLLGTSVRFSNLRNFMHIFPLEEQSSINDIIEDGVFKIFKTSSRCEGRACHLQCLETTEPS
jgi:hypothetical protein